MVASSQDIVRENKKFEGKKNKKTTYTSILTEMLNLNIFVL